MKPFKRKWLSTNDLPAARPIADNDWDRVINNINSVRPYLSSDDGTPPRSRPGGWYGNFVIIFNHFSRIPQFYSPKCVMLYLAPIIIGSGFLLAIRCCAQFG